MDLNEMRQRKAALDLKAQQAAEKAQQAAFKAQQSKARAEDYEQRVRVAALRADTRRKVLLGTAVIAVIRDMPVERALNVGRDLVIRLEPRDQKEIKTFLEELIKDAEMARREAAVQNAVSTGTAT